MILVSATENTERLLVTDRRMKFPAKTFPLKMGNTSNPVVPEAPGFYRKYDPDPSLTEFRFSQLLVILQLFADWKSTLPILEAANNSRRAQAGELTKRELEEAMAELEKIGGSTSQAIIEFFAEMTDTFNIPASMVSHFNLPIDLQEIAARANGDARYPKVWDRARDIAVNFSEDHNKLAKDIEQLFLLLLSIVKYAPPLRADLLIIMAEKMQKNRQNYPIKAFTSFDEMGKELDADEKNQKYDHVYKCLRWLRYCYPDHCLPKDWQVVKCYIENFRKSDENFEALKTEWFRLHPELLKVLVPKSEPNLPPALKIKTPRYKSSPI